MGDTHRGVARQSALRRGVGGLALWLLAACAGTPLAAPRGGSDGLRSLIAAERAFARHSEREGMRPAFTANLAPDGILFRPGPVNGLNWFETNPPPAVWLSWEPAAAGIASAGDMGYTTGPWELRARGASDTISAAGHYVTVWRRDSTGTWQIAIDIGTAHRPLPRPAQVAAGVFAQRDSLGARAIAGVLQRDSLLGASGRPQANVLLPALHDSARVQREGLLPALGSVPARQLLAGDLRAYHARPLGGAVSAAGEFGYTYGEYQLLPSFTHPPERGFYLRLWRPAADGTWRVILDLAQPVRGG